MSVPLTAPASAVGFGTQTFRLSDLTNAGSFTSLFDLYKITGAKVKFIPKYNMADPTGTSNATNGLPILYLATNRDPFVPAPTSIADILNDDTCKMYRMDKPLSWYVKSPKVDNTISWTVQGTQYTAPFNLQFGTSKKFQPWLTTGGNGQSLDQSQLNHYGIRWALDNSQCSSVIGVEVFVTLYFTMKEQD